MKLVPTIDVTATATGCQRWRERRPRHRPAGEPFEPGRHAVEPLEQRQARPFVEGHHYSASWVAARRSYGLLRAGEGLVGVCVFGVPVQPRTIPRYAPGALPAEGVELARLVLLDHVEGNAESWFVSRALRFLRADLSDVRVVVSYSDPVLRVDVDGVAVLPGHVGTVYQALGATYLGRGSPRRLILGPDGRTVSARALSKIRLGERGAVPAYDRLVAQGAPRLRPGEAPAAWVRRALDEGPFCALNHPGNHVYRWLLSGPPVESLTTPPYPRRDPEAGSAVASPRASTTGPVQLGLWGAA